MKPGIWQGGFYAACGGSGCCFSVVDSNSQDESDGWKTESFSREGPEPEDWGKSQLSRIAQDEKVCVGEDTEAMAGLGQEESARVAPHTGQCPGRSEGGGMEGRSILDCSGPVGQDGTVDCSNPMGQDRTVTGLQTCAILQDKRSGELGGGPQSL